MLEPNLSTPARTSAGTCILKTMGRMKETRPSTIEYGDAFALIAEMARDFAEAQDFDGVLARALGSIVSHVGAEAGSLWILDAAVGELACITCVGPSLIVGMRLPASTGCPTPSSAPHRKQ